MSLVLPPGLMLGAASGPPPSNLTTFTVDDVAHTNGQTIGLANGVTSVIIAATNGGSIEDLAGDAGLATGNNTCTFTVRAEDGATTLDVSITLHVLNNATTFTVDGVPHTNGQTIDLAHGVTGVTIAATNGGSIEDLAGDTGLATGNNTCTFTVVAEDGTELDVSITLHVLNNATTFTVDGVSKTNGTTVNLASGVTSVSIAATNGGSIEDLAGDTGLVTGNNTCTFTVVAEDGTELDVSITLHVAASTATTFTVDGTPQTDGATVDLANGTTSVAIIATNGGSIEDIAGNGGLVTGDNVCTFTVRAEDGVTTLDVSITLRVAAASVPVNTVPPTVTGGTTVGDVLTPGQGTWTGSPSSYAYEWFRDGVSQGVSATYTLTPADIGALITLEETAHNTTGDSTPEPSSNDSGTIVGRSATTFTVNGVAKTSGDTVNLVNGTTDVTIAATDGGSITTGPAGDTSLVTGDNSCTFTITAEDGVTTLDVTLNLHVLTVGAAEVTEVTTNSDAGGSSNGTYFPIYDSAGSVGVWFSKGGVRKTHRILINNPTNSFVTSGAGMALILPFDPTHIHGIWMNTGTETQPDLSGSGVTNYFECPLVLGENTFDTANRISTFINGIGGWGINAGNPFEAVTSYAGVLGDGSSTDATMTVSVLIEGVDGPSAPGGFDRTVMVGTGDDFPDTVLAANIVTALNGAVFSVSAVDAVVTITDNTAGARIDASAGTSGFSINVTTEGVDPV